MKGICFMILLVAGFSSDPVAASFFEDIWEAQQDFFDKINEKIEESNKPDLLTIQPTMKPTLSPTISIGPSYQSSSSPSDTSEPSNQPSAKPSSQPSIIPSSAPSSTPTNQPSTNPTLSISPTNQPSTYPTSSLYPSSEPSLSPTISTSPSRQPSAQPTLSSSPSTKPSSAPSTSISPSTSPSSEPTSTPSTYPSTSPSLFPTTVLSMSPSNEPSSVPSAAPSETKPIITRIIIKSDSSSRNLVAVGAASLLLMASVAVYVSKNKKRLRGRDMNDVDDVLNLRHSSSIRKSGDESEQHSHDATKRSVVNFACQLGNHEEPDLVEIDLEDGRDIKQTEESIAESSIDLNSLPGGAKEKTLSTISKIFKRRPIGAEKQATMTWLDIRDDGSPACSSGCEPAKGGNSITSLSPMFSPLKNNISSARMRLQSLISISSEETDDLPSVEGSFDGHDKMGKSVVSPMNVRENDQTSSVRRRFNGNTTNIERQQCSDVPSVFNGVTSPGSIFSGVGDSSDVSRMSSAGQNMDQLKNILGTIKTLGNVEESFISTASTGTSVTDFKKKAKARLGLNQGQAKCHQNVPSVSQEKVPTRNEISVSRAGITFERELLSATNSSCDGFNFKQIYTDPRNEICECHMPSGPLGIIAEATKVGIRVRKINSMSPLCNKISVGDVIIAVDEVDVVGMESGAFWQLVSRRANKQQRCFVVLRI